MGLDISKAIASEAYRKYYNFEKDSRSMNNEEEKLFMQEWLEVYLEDAVQARNQLKEIYGLSDIIRLYGKEPTVSNQREYSRNFVAHPELVTYDKYYFLRMCFILRGELIDQKEKYLD